MILYITDLRIISKEGHMSNRYHQAMRAFRMADRALRRVIEKRVASTGVYRSQHQMLMNLGRNPDCSQNELAMRLDITPAAVTTTIKKLEKGGYITRIVCKEDNRINKLSVTEKGQQIISKSITIFDEVEAQALKGFSEEEIQQFEDFVSRIHRNLEEV
jgi:DNA-binding MarR family transcriptional regulator